MTEKETGYILIEGGKKHQEGEYKEAIEYWLKIPKKNKEYLKAQWNIGFTYSELNIHERAIEYWDKIPPSDKMYLDAQWNIGFIYYKLNDYEKAIEYWKKTPPEYKQYIEAQWNIGFSYYQLKEFKKAIEYFKKIPLNHKYYYDAQWNIGSAYFWLKDKPKAAKAFIDSLKEVLEMLQVFKTGKVNIIKETFSLILDHKKDDFFNTTITNDSINKKEYKDIFIQSLYIISLLHIDTEHEKQVAHYTRKWVAEQMLFAKSQLRLSTIIGANDPKEGITLLDFLDIGHKAKSQTPYQAFITCFTFNHESLNQFRLYGKENNKEATGVSIIGNKDFFSSTPSLNISHAKNDLIDSAILDDKNSKKAPEQKYSLYRCIYIDPKTKKVISIGHKEEYSFYREIKRNGSITTSEKKKMVSEMKEYQKGIQKTLRKIRNQVNLLNSYIEEHKNDLDESIISELLLPLRYLIKHVAFKEEQECRIFDIENLQTSKKILPINPSSFSEMYIEYNEDITQHIEKIIFAPMTDGLEQFRTFSKYKGYNFPCERCDHPFSSKTT